MQCLGIVVLRVDTKTAERLHQGIPLIDFRSRLYFTRSTSVCIAVARLT